jgi:class 3 adenylate cyclase
LEKVGGSKETVDLGNSFNLMMGELNHERERSENLLLNILPAPVAKRLKNGEEKIAMSTDNITILFADLVGFTKYSSTVSAEELVDMLNLIFREIDDLIIKYNLEKIKTIGDCYMIAGGIFGEEKHVSNMFILAQDMMNVLDKHNEKYHTTFQIRIGIHYGQAVAGVLGKSKFVFDVWGDSVNIASRMESSGEPNRIQASADYRDALKNNSVNFDEVDRGHIPIKGKGEMNCFFIS